jgi:hypothetical protein
MQDHIDCHAGVCPTKSAAWLVLVERGLLVPDPDRWDGRA